MIKDNIDATIKPGEDFYGYACGGWQKSHPLKGEYSLPGVVDRLIKEGKAEIPSVTGDVEWVLASNKHRNKFCLLMVNSTSKAHKVNLSIAGLEFAAPTYRTITCPEEFLDCCEVPDEQRPWTAVAWEDTSRGYWFPDMEMYKGLKPKCDVLPITIKPHTIQTVTFMTRRARNAK